MSKQRISLFFPLLMIVIAVLVVIFPLFRQGFFVSDDGDWMIVRLSAFYQSFREGQFPVRLLGRLNHGYGYPVANFLYPGFLYIGSILKGVGVSFVWAVKLILIGSVMTGALAMFAWLKERFDNTASVMGVMGYLFGPYVVFDIYTRGSVGEILAIGVMPVVLLAADRQIQWLLSLSVALLILSHNTLALLFAVFFFFYLLVSRRLLPLLWPIILGIGAAAFFWWPAIAERRFVGFDQIAVSNPAQYFLNISTIWLIGPVFVIAFIMAFVVKKKPAMVMFMMWTTALVSVLVLPIAGPIWQLRLPAALIQFPYRVLAVGLISGAYLIAFVVDRVSSVRRVALLFPFAVLWIIPLVSMLSQIRYVNFPETYYTTNEATTNVADEYMPRWVRVPPTSHAYEKIRFFSGKGVIDIRRANAQKIDVMVTAEESSIIEIAAIYYPGWGIIIDGLPAVIDYQNPTGVMRVPIAPGRHRLQAEFRETRERFFIDIISAVCLGLIGISALVKKKT